MKKLFTLALMAGVSATAFAQRTINVAPNAHRVSVAHAANTAAKTTSSNLSVFPFSFADTAAACGFYTGDLDTNGYLGGSNAYGDKQKMMRYDLDSFGAELPATVDTIKVFFSGKRLSGQNSNIVASVYSATGSGMPGSLLGTSSNVSASSIDTSGGLTSFIFAAPVNLTTNEFFLSVDFTDTYAKNDTIGIVIQNDCPSIDTMQAWDQFDNNTYSPASSVADWGTPLSYFIIGQLTATPLSIKNVAQSVFGAKVFPNPASGNATISFTSPANGNTQVQLKDITGKTVINHTVATVKGQSYNEKLDVSSLSSGLYFCEIISGANRGVIKVTVQ